MNYQPMQTPYARNLADGRTAGLTAFLRQLYMYMAGALAVTAVVAQFTLVSPTILSFTLTRGGSLGLFVVQMGIAVYFSSRVTTMTAFGAASLLAVFAGLMGVSLAPLALVYTGASLSRAFMATGITFGGAAIYGLTTKRSLEGMGHFAIVGIWGVVAASLVNIFLRSPAIDYVLSMAAVVAFTAMTAVRNGHLREIYRMQGGAGNAAIQGALDLYLYFINIFVSLLRLFGEERR